MIQRPALTAGLLAVVVGLLAVGFVLVGGAEPPEEATVERSTDPADVLSHSFKRLESADYLATRSTYNIQNTHRNLTEKIYFKVSNRHQRLVSGFVSSNGTHLPSRYVTTVATWEYRNPNWKLTDRNEWDHRVPTFPKAEAFGGVNATIRNRSDTHTLVEIDNVSAVSRFGGVENRTEQWLFTIDNRNHTLLRAEKWVETQAGDELLIQFEFEYRVTVERPDGIPFSVEEQYYRSLAMDRSEKIGLIGGAVLILVGMGVLYREYPLYQKVRRKLKS